MMDSKTIISLLKLYKPTDLKFDLNLFCLKSKIQLTKAKAILDIKKTEKKSKTNKYESDLFYPLFL